MPRPESFSERRFAVCFIFVKTTVSACGLAESQLRSRSILSSLESAYMACETVATGDSV